MNIRSIDRLSDEQLLADLKATVARERDATARLIALLAEMDARRLYLAHGYSSLFVYCTRCLHLSEHAAYGRIEAARAARRFPVILDWVTDGSLTLTTICLLANQLTAENHQRVLQAARHKSKREVEQQVAALRPLPLVPSVVRKLPQSRLSPASPAGVDAEKTGDVPPLVNTDRAATALAEDLSVRREPPVIRPLAPERYKVQLTINRETHDKLRKVQDLLRHVVPNGDPAVIFERALTLLLQDLQRRKLARVDRPRPSTSSRIGCRHLPAAVRRAVWQRDDGQCAFVGTEGRCAERGLLEFHHVIPFADGGPTTVENLQLRCRAHNAYEAKQYFGSLLLRERPPNHELGLDRVGYVGTISVPAASTLGMRVSSTNTKISRSSGVQCGTTCR